MRVRLGALPVRLMRRVVALLLAGSALVALPCDASGLRRPAHVLTASASGRAPLLATRTQAAAASVASAVAQRAATQVALLASAEPGREAAEALGAAAIDCARYARDPRPFAQLRGRLYRPVDEGWQTVAFGTRRSSSSRTYVRHSGLTFGVPARAEARSVAGGVVVAAQFMRGWGNVVVVDHGRDYHSVYAHLGPLFVERGDAVGGGVPLGVVAQRSTFDERELYFELRHQGIPIDPAPWF